MSYAYALIGLTPTERTLLESIFSLDAAQGEDLVQVRTPEQAHLIIVDGDDRGVVRTMRQRNPEALLVVAGRSPAGMELPALRRPLEMNSVVQVLSGLEWPADVVARESGRTPLAGALNTNPQTLTPESVTPPLSQPADESAFALTTAATGAMPTAVEWAPPEVEQGARAVASDGGVWRSTPVPVEGRDTAAGGVDWHGQQADILVVIARREQRQHTLPRGLRRMGYPVRVVEGPEAALTEFARRPYRFVFLDQATLGAELLPLTRSFNAQRSEPGQPPHIAVVARRGALLGRVRLRMAGCEAWMQVPIDKERLTDYFDKRGLAPMR